MLNLWLLTYRLEEARQHHAEQGAFMRCAACRVGLVLLRVLLRVLS